MEGPGGTLGVVHNCSDETDVINFVFDNVTDESYTLGSDTIILVYGSLMSEGGANSTWTDDLMYIDIVIGISGLVVVQTYNSTYQSTARNESNFTSESAITTWNGSITTTVGSPMVVTVNGIDVMTLNHPLNCRLGLDELATRMWLLADYASESPLTVSRFRLVSPITEPSPPILQRILFTAGNTTDTSGFSKFTINEEGDMNTTGINDEST